MHTRRHIDVNHYALNNQGRAVCVTPVPNALEGTHPNTKVPFTYVGQHHYMLQFICIKLQIRRYLHIVVPTALVALHVEAAT